MHLNLGFSFVVVVVFFADSMLRIAVQDFSPRASVEGPPRSFSLPFSSLTIINGLSQNSFSYAKVTKEPIKLSVLKLDGSSFDIEVMNSATIGELMLAVEAVFFHMPKISWLHVWGHFCLCYDGQKLVRETDYISNYGIKDGDQLCFIRHISNNYILTKKQSKKWVVPSFQKKWSLSESRNCEENEQKDEDSDDCDDIENWRYKRFDDKDGELVAQRHYDDKDGEVVAHHHYNDGDGEVAHNEDNDDCDDIENWRYQRYDDKDGELVSQRHFDDKNGEIVAHHHYNDSDGEVAHNECSFADILRGWFSYSRLPTAERTKVKGLADYP